MKNKKSLLIFIIVIAVSTGLVFLFQKKLIALYNQRDVMTQSFMNTIHPKPEAFTELYFQNNENLPTKPKVITNYQAVVYSFSFSIHNLENTNVRYPYVVSISGATNKVLDKKVVTVSNGQTKTVSESFILPNAITTKTKITVTLVNKNQEIHFWMKTI